MAPAKYTRAFVLGILIFASILIAQRYDRNSLIAERPVHSAIIVLFVTGIVLNATARFFAKGGVEDDTSRVWDLAVFLKSHSRINLRVTSIPITSGQLISSLVVQIIIARVGTARGIIDNDACSQRGVEAFFPFLLALVEALIFRNSSHPSSLPADETSKSRTLQSPSNALVHSRLRHLLPALLLTLGTYISSVTLPRSTYICPKGVGNLSSTHYVTFLQYVGLCLDIMTYAVMIWLLECYKNTRSRLVAFGDVLLSSAVGLGVIGGLYLIFHMEFLDWAINIGWVYIGNAFLDALIIALFLLSVLVLSADLRPFTIVVIMIFAFNLESQLPLAADGLFSRIGGLNNFSLPLTFLGTAGYFYIESTSEAGRSLSGIFREAWIYRILVLIFCIFEVLYFVRSPALEVHPADTLVANAKMQHEQWLRQATSGLTLQDAAANYQARYHRSPPPHFDKWYDFAKSRNSVVIDDYDQIERDLRPFMTMAPWEIRRLTNEMLMNQWNDIAGLSIRNGKTQVSPHIVGTHRWMLDGITGMIDKFSEWLPDMDLGFNINDEPRVIIPWSEAGKIRRKETGVGKNLLSGLLQGFSKNGAYDIIQPWQNETAELENGPTSVFPDHSFEQTFFSFATSHCPPSSPAKVEYYWRRDLSCRSCVAPFTNGGFISNWTLANDMCIQPDMAYFHGFHLAPSTFKTSRKLLPVFSQSKVDGYNDILYPSPWNYQDKVKFEEDKYVPWERKAETLFWRGATSEGKSEEGQWVGMQRQRFVHWANNESDSTLIPMLMPASSSPSSSSSSSPDSSLNHGPSIKPPTENSTTPRFYKPTHLPLGHLRKLLSLDLGFVEGISRCGQTDCPAQMTEFGLKPGVDFQDHWKYKYLLDLDGAGFSGRFIPFLQSGSLIFKAALFREWWADRVMPWQHFVPLDYRGRELASLVGFFAGFGEAAPEKADGDDRTSNVSSAQSKGGRDDLAEYIAKQGREWVNTALRKEDMEVYFFRLLLEWGRIVDDRREEVGFEM